jgi:hypothetical protein
MNRNAGEIDRRGIEDTAHGNDHVHLADVILFNEKFEEACALLLLLFQQLRNLPLRQQAIFDQGVGDSFAK